LNISVQTMGIFQQLKPRFRRRQALDVSDGLTVRELLVGTLALGDPDSCMVALRGRRIGLDEVLHAGDELMVFPMISGG
jgi:molybdopterin converting factor small subunit